MAPRLDLSSLKLEYDPAVEVPKQNRPMGLQEAPTYWPTEKEWADPVGYIQSIADEGKKYGIVKVYILYPLYISSEHAYTM
jgi:[histone H3]-trimethyl-L-lysine4 demethylase